MKHLGLALTALAVVCLAATASAHHSAAQFDFGKSAQVTGIVKKFEAINPHMRLVLQVTDAKGTREIFFEGHSTNNMYRAGYRNGMIKLGDKITVTIAPTRDGSDGGYVTAAVTASGAKFGVGGGADQTQERTRAESK